MEHEEQNERIIDLRSGPRRMRLYHKATKRGSNTEKQEKPCETPKTLNTAERVFGIEELCEMILSNLPSRAVLATRRVSRTFQSTIQGSQQLKRQAFLLPAEVTDAQVVKLNDLIFSNSDLPFDLKWHPARLNWFKFTGFRMGSIRQLRRRLRKQETVKKMFVTQPPVSTLQIHLLHNLRYRDVVSVEVASGVTVGDVVKATSRLRREFGDKLDGITLGIDHHIKVVSDKPDVSHWPRLVKCV